MGNTGKTLPVWAVNLKKYRLQVGLSQSQFGEKFGVTKMAVSYWESGQVEPPVPVLAWIVMQGNATGAQEIWTDEQVRDFENGQK